MLYLTLSYTWGAQNLKPTQTSGRRETDSLDDAPLTIRDAMTVTIKLGYQYLWVDRYCIDQFNEKERRAQIHGMASIYRSCVATVVALGADDRSGLPGVSSRRDKPEVVITSHCDFLNTSPGVRQTVAASLWNSRGWTWQESLFSPRLIIFGKEQVFLTCGSGTVSESVVGISHLHKYREDKIWPSPDGQSIFDGLALGRAGCFGDALKEYTSRSLTHASDSLNAFRGYLSICGLYSYWGVPIFHIDKNQHKKPRGNGVSKDQKIDTRQEWTWLGSLSIDSANNLLSPDGSYQSHDFRYVSFCAGLAWYHAVQKVPSQNTLVPAKAHSDKAYSSWSWISCYSPTNLTIHSGGSIDLQDVLFAPELTLEYEDRSTVLLDELSNNHDRNQEMYATLPETGTIIRLRSRLSTFHTFGAPEENLPYTEVKLPVMLDWLVLEGMSGQQDEPHSQKTTFLPDRREEGQCRWSFGREEVAGAGHAIPFYWQKHENEVALFHSYLKAYWIAVQFDTERRCWFRVGLIISIVFYHRLSGKLQEMLADAVKVEVAELRKGDCLRVLRIG